MYLFTNFILFVCIWWVFFFISLPINILIPDHSLKGHANSAPKKTFAGYKIIITTITNTIGAITHTKTEATV